MATRLGMRCLGVLVAVMLLGACATKPPPGYYDNQYYGNSQSAPVEGSANAGRPIATAGVAVLGVVSGVKDLRDFQRKNLANELETHIRAAEHGVAVLPYSQVRAALRSQGQHRLMLDRYKLNGRLTETDWSILRASLLPARYVVIARIDRDNTTQFQPVKTPMKNGHGDSLTDRQQVRLFHKRTVEVAARVYDMQTGSELWSAAFVSVPMNQTSYTEYTGSSFTGSMATLLTNSFVNGRTAKKHPPAPSASEALREAFKGIAQALSGRTFAAL